MSGWADYVNYLLAGNVCQTGYILGKTNGAVWSTNTGLAALPSYTIQVEGVACAVNETDLLLKAIQNNGVPTDPNVGIRINNQKYYSVRFDAENGTWYLKKDQGGASISLTVQTIVIATFDANLKSQDGLAQNPGAVNKRVEALSQILKKANY